jgi:ketosteroid isomerase-like protein
MSAANVEIVTRAVEAFNRHDLEALSDLSHDDLEFVSVLTAVDAGAATYRKHRTWTAYFADMDLSWEKWQVGDFRVYDGPEDRLAATFRLTGKAKRSGVPIAREVGITYRIRDGKLWRVRSYPDPQEALGAMRLEVVKSLLEAQARGDMPAMLACLDPEVEWIPARAATEGAYRGHDGARKFAADTNRSFEVFEPRLELQHAGGRILARGTIHVRGAGSGADVEFPVAGVFEFRDALIVRWQDFRSEQSLLAALGASE